MSLTPGARLGVYESSACSVPAAWAWSANRDKMMPSMTVLIAAICLFPSVALAQTETRRVSVDVAAASGSVVTDLRADEFDISEGGERRDISSVKFGRRPVRIVFVVDSTDAIRQPIGTVRKALTTFIEAIDLEIEMMLVTVAGTPHVRVRPTLERHLLVKSVDGIFGTNGSNVMHRIIDDLFHRFAQTTGHRPIFVVLTTEGFESTQNINPQEIKHLTDHFLTRGGTLHAVRLLVSTNDQSVRSGTMTDLPVSLIIGRDTGGAYTNISPNGLLEVLKRLATVINETYATTLNYQIEFATVPVVKGKKPAAPHVRVLREGVQLNVIATP